MSNTKEISNSDILRVTKDGEVYEANFVEPQFNQKNQVDSRIVFVKVKKVETVIREFAKTYGVDENDERIQEIISMVKLSFTPTRAIIQGTGNREERFLKLIIGLILDIKPNIDSLSGLDEE